MLQCSLSCHVQLKVLLLLFMCIASESGGLGTFIQGLWSHPGTKAGSGPNDNTILVSPKNAPTLPGTAGTLARNDIIIVLPSSSGRHILVEASRSLRKGIRTFVVTNSTADEAMKLTQENEQHQEVYVHFPDEIREDKKKPFSKRPGDHRAAMAPFLAHQFYNGDYKWMLYGDDDTLFFPGSTLALLQHLDHTQPVAMTDHLWLLQSRPNPESPRCLPCSRSWREAAAASLAAVPSTEVPGLKAGGHVAGGQGAVTTAGSGISHQAPNSSSSTAGTLKPDRGYIPKPGCPWCSQEVACAHAIESGQPCRPAGAHGGAGIFMSLGLMKEVPRWRIEKCFNHNRGSSGGDRLLSACLHHHNVSWTDPGYWAVRYEAQAAGAGAAGEPGLSMDLTFAQYSVFDNKLFRTIVMAPAEHLNTRARCGSHCRWLIGHAVSLHVGVRHLKSMELAAKVMRTAAASHLKAIAQLTSQSL